MGMLVTLQVLKLVQVCSHCDVSGSHLGPDTCVGFGQFADGFPELVGRHVGSISLALLASFAGVEGALDSDCSSSVQFLFHRRFAESVVFSVRSLFCSPCHCFLPLVAARFASSSAFSLPFSPSCPGIHRIVMSILENLSMRVLCILRISSVRYDPGRVLPLGVSPGLMPGCRPQCLLFGVQFLLSWQPTLSAAGTLVPVPHFRLRTLCAVLLFRGGVLLFSVLSAP